MTKFAKMITVFAALGAFAPLAANADGGMAQSNPIIYPSHNQYQPKFAAGRTAHVQQMQALNRVAQANQAQSLSHMARVQHTNSTQRNG